MAMMAAHGSLPRNDGNWEEIDRMGARVAARAEAGFDKGEAWGGWTLVDGYVDARRGWVDAVWVVKEDGARKNG